MLVLHLMRAFITLFIVFYSLTTCFAQPLPCETPAAMTSFCDEACIICDIDGFSGTNNSNVQGWAPASFCTTNQHNIQWIAFMAGSVDLTLNVAVSGCNIGEGLEVAIYLSTDCENYQMVSNCDGEILENTSQNFSNTVPLVIGQYYYFVMDGNTGDICDYEITVIEGNTLVAPLFSSGEISGDLELCLETTETYTTTTQEGATLYEWTIDGAPAGDLQTIDATFDVPGDYDLCVVASNVCDVAPPTCAQIDVVSVAPTVINGTFCGDDCFIAAGDTFCTTGTYPIVFTSYQGCDSLVTVNVLQIPSSETDFTVEFCEGDTLSVGGNPYYETGSYQEVLTNYLGCDSTVTFGIGLITCEININALTSNVACNGETTGSITFVPTTGLAPYMYSWQHLGSSGIGTGTIAAVNQSTTVNNLSFGTYVVTISNNFGEDAVAIMEITEPLAMTASITGSSTDGFNLACFGGNEGLLTASAAGGNGGFSYSWSDGGNAATIQNLVAGTYTVTVTDANGCTITSTYLLTQPEPFVFEPDFTNASCDGLSSGYITIPPVSGGVGPYLYALSGQDYGDLLVFVDILPGNYTVLLQDAHGCTDSVTGAITAPIIPEINILADSMRMDLAAEIALTTEGWGYIDLLWTGDSLSCYNCLSPISSAVWSGNYMITAISSDSCLAYDMVFLEVVKVRPVFVPNAFSNDANGNNDAFTVFAGPQVRRVLTLNVYDRWGNQVFENSNFQPNQEQYGWDGTFRGRTMANMSFGWYAKVEFIDGVVVEYEGDVSIVK
jgi:gliding motility-associated-like protein